MITLPPSVRLFLATEPVDGRKGIDGLVALVRNQFEHNAFTGHLYVFFSRHRDRVRILYWDRNGFALWLKRLEKGRFRIAHLGDTPLAQLEAAQLTLILEGIELREARHRARWQPPEQTYRGNNFV